MLSEMILDAQFPSAQFDIDSLSAPFSLTGATLH